jgi:hypothetical protein
MTGIKSIATGVQYIEPASRRACYLPGRDTATPFPCGVQTYIYIIILRLLRVVKPQVADGAVLNKTFLDMHSMQALISMDKSDILQQLIEYPELFGVLLFTPGIFDKMDDEVGCGNAFFPLQKRELRMIAQSVGKQPGMFMRVDPEQGRILFTIALSPGLSEMENQYDQ